MEKLRWLHISDIHFCRKNDWRDTTARNTLIDFLKQEFENDQLAKPDMIFCTGDIAQGETATGELIEQYASAQAFFNKLLDVCGLAKERLFIVPGNHDVNRTTVSRKFQHSLTTVGIDEINKDWADQNSDYKQAIARLDEYGDFVKNYLPHQADTNGRHCYTSIIEINGMKLGVAGFNSAWSCYGDEDRNNLWMAAEWQFNAAAKVLDNQVNLSIGLMHHPVSWFKPDDTVFAKKRIQAHFDFWLHGHEHDGWVVPSDQGVTTVGAGAVNAHQDAEFGINLVELGFTDSKGQVNLFTYKAADNVWLACPCAGAPRGIYDFSFKSVADFSEPDKREHHSLSPENAVSNPSSITTVDDATRIKATYHELRAYLGAGAFKSVTDVSFADDEGFPLEISKMFKSPVNPPQRLDIADKCMLAIRRFAKRVVDYINKLPEESVQAIAGHKVELRARLINAMQHAILLSANAIKLHNVCIDSAYDLDKPLELDVQLCESVSVLLRDELSDHLSADFSKGRFHAFEDNGSLKLPSDIELGTLSQDNRPGAEFEVLKAVFRHICPGEKLPETLSKDLLRGELQLLKDDKNHMFVIFESKNNSHTPAFIEWLNGMCIGVVRVTIKEGLFEIAEGTWRARLADLYKTLTPFEPEAKS